MRFDRLILFYLRFRKLSWYVKGFCLKLFIQCLGGSVGTSLKCKDFPVFRSLYRCKIMIGDNVTIGYNITFDIGATATLLIGDGVNLTQDIIISAVERVEIGKYCLVAENVSIRDANHGTSRVKNINTQGLCSAPIKINDDVWLGAGVKVLKGATIAEGCIIGSNGIVLESSKCHDYKIYAGAPIREIGERD